MSNIANPRNLERKRRAAQIEGCGPCTEEFIMLLRIRILELTDMYERTVEELLRLKQ
jgi:hypothetical protein